MDRVREHNERSIASIVLLTPLLAVFGIAAGFVLGGVVGALFFESRYDQTDSAGIGILGGLFVGSILGYLIGCFIAAWYLSRKQTLSARTRLLIGAWLPAGLIAGVIVHAFAVENGHQKVGVLVAIGVSASLLSGLIFSEPNSRRSKWLGVGGAALVIALGSTIGLLK